MRSKARMLRKNQTDAEKFLWQKLRNRQLLGYKFRRQHAIGSYIVDIVCIERKLIIEIDGGQHIEQHDYDLRRTKYFESLGFQVLRFWNNQVLTEMSSVLEVICNILDNPSPTLSPKRGEGVRHG